ncbi:MAG: aminotransferase class I/II-fold pyridoxal phosphate-dependent enzyme [Solirubrobacteraceae bacterium]
MSDLLSTHGPLPDPRHAPYLEALAALRDANPGRYMVPGHLGGPFADEGFVAAAGAYALSFDLPPLIDGIDAGPPPHPFQQAQLLAAEAWGARRTWFLSNGASNGNHVALMTFAQSGRSRIVMQRNVHGSCIDGLILSGLEPFFVQPEVDHEMGIAHCVTPESFDRALSEAGPELAGAVIVSPTYYGFAADTEALVAVAHAHNVPLLIDEAWGSHFAFHPELPIHATAAGADLTNSSTHKMLGSLTQSAMIHLGGRLIDESTVDNSVRLVESTSPNALLGASLDAARRRAVQDGRRLITESLAQLSGVREDLRKIPGVDVLDDREIGRHGIAGWDPFRVVIDLRQTGIEGTVFQRLLREEDEILIELASAHAVVAIWGLGAGADERARFVQAVHGALRRGQAGNPGAHRDQPIPLPAAGPTRLPPRAAFLSTRETVPLRSAIGRVAAQSLAVYPPGIPNVLPGEEITTAVVDYLEQAGERGHFIRGANDPGLTTIQVVR